MSGTSDSAISPRARPGATFEQGGLAGHRREGAGDGDQRGAGQQGARQVGQRRGAGTDRGAGAEPDLRDHEQGEEEEEGRDGEPEVGEGAVGGQVADGVGLGEAEHHRADERERHAAQAAHHGGGVGVDDQQA